MRGLGEQIGPIRERNTTQGSLKLDVKIRRYEETCVDILRNVNVLLASIMRANIMHELSLINNTHTGNTNPTNYTLMCERQMSSLSPQKSFYREGV